MKKKGRGHSLQSEKWPFNAVSWTWILNTEFCFSPWPSLALKGSEFQRYTEVSIVFVSLCFSTHTQTHILISLYICKKFFSRFFFFKIYPFMRWREKERERGREGRYCGRERKGKRVNPKKTPCQAWRQTWPQSHQPKITTSGEIRSWELNPLVGVFDHLSILPVRLQRELLASNGK